MKKILLIPFVVLPLFGALTACTENQTYLNDYGSSSGYVRTYQGDSMHTGYNRAYQHRRGSPVSAAEASEGRGSKRKWPDPATYENTNKTPTAPDVGYQTKPHSDSQEGMPRS